MFEVCGLSLYYGFIVEFAGETIFKICEHLAKLQARSEISFLLRRSRCVQSYCGNLNCDISEGSVVTQLRCGRIINKGFVANLLVNLSVKEF